MFAIFHSINATKVLVFHDPNELKSADRLFAGRVCVPNIFRLHIDMGVAANDYANNNNYTQ